VGSPFDLLYFHRPKNEAVMDYDALRGSPRVWLPRKRKKKRKKESGILFSFIFLIKKLRFSFFILFQADLAIFNVN
jgi:hypothetical protein